MYSFSLQRASSPIKDHHKTLTINDLQGNISLEDVFLETGDSTLSLLTPLYDNDYHYQSSQTNDFEDKPGKSTSPDNTKNDTLDDSLLSHQSISPICSAKSPNNSLTSCTKGESDVSTLQSCDLGSFHKVIGINESNTNNISWEQWLVKKAMTDIENLDLQKEKKKQQSMDRRKLEEEKIAKLKKSVNIREEWVKKKDLEWKNKIREKEAQIHLEKSKEKNDKRIIDEKAEAKFEEWQQNKLEKEKDRLKVLKEEKRKVQEKYKEKKQSSDESYKTWLEKSKSKQFNRSTYGYSGGNLFSYYDMGCSPAPSYRNPLPWVDIPINNTNNEKTPNKQLFSSPPLLWKNIEQREDSKKCKRTKPKRVIVKHSCINDT